MYLARVQNALDTASPGERRIAAWILEDPSRVLGSAITEVARNCEVSEATVVRFCKSLGLEGYRDFRIRMAQELGAVAPELNEWVPDFTSQTEGLASIVFENNIKAMRATLASLNYEEVEKAIGILTSANRVEFIGVGPSSVVAMDAHLKFLRIGVSSSFSHNANVQAMSASLLKPGDAALAVSYSGTTRDTIDALAAARQAGASTIAVTNYCNMPIAEVADVMICTKAARELLQGGGMTSRVAQLAVIDLLFSGVIALKPDLAAANLRRTRGILLKRLGNPEL